MLLQLEGHSESRLLVSESANINVVWATLVVEELVRLGLTVKFLHILLRTFVHLVLMWSPWQYFCIAPGSRSSPLAISASTHRLTTCISCFDERSMAFHAVGYARGSSRPAVVITSSGTAVSNLLPAVGFVDYICINNHYYTVFSIISSKNSFLDFA